MTKEQFDLKYCGEKVAVHCDTEEKAKAFLSLAKSFGYKWSSAYDLDEFNYWEINKENTCYRFYKNNAMTDSKVFYEKNCYKIVEFELYEPNGYAIEDTPSPMKETFKVGDVVTYKLLGVTAKIVDIKPHYLLEGYGYYVNETEIKKTKPLKEITEKELADMGYVLVK